MKTIIFFFLLLAVSLIFTSCSGDDEILIPLPVNENLQDEDQPVPPLPDVEAVGIPGFPKTIEYYYYDELTYWVQYYYSPDGKLLKVNYSYPDYSSEILTETYHYNDEGRITGLEGENVYTFHWENDRIVGADKYNAMWSGSSKIFYKYNSQGRIIEKAENNLDFLYSEKTLYTYFDEGNLESVEQYGDYYGDGEFTRYYLTTYPAYTENVNLFYELVIIPGQNVQQQFPASMILKSFTEVGYDRQEIYRYKYDAQKRVVEKAFEGTKVIYQYY